MERETRERENEKEKEQVEILLETAKEREEFVMKNTQRNIKCKQKSRCLLLVVIVSVIVRAVHCGLEQTRIET